MKIVSQIIEAFLLGIIGGAVPGPILTAVFTEVLNGGFKRSFIVMLKALVAESLVAGLVLLFFFSWDIPTEYFYIISFGGAIVLFWIAKRVWGIEKVASDKKEIFSFSKLLLLTVLNGAFWIFWITICVPRAFELKQAISGGHVLFLLFFEAGWLITVILLAYVFSKFRPLLLEKKLISIVFKIFALLLVFFGLKSLWGSFVYFMM
ncbi:MAG: LysE family transporter [Candidatus Gracilibacteria bacterium]